MTDEPLDLAELAEACDSTCIGSDAAQVIDGSLCLVLASGAYVEWDGSEESADLMIALRDALKAKRDELDAKPMSTVRSRPEHEAEAMRVAEVFLASPVEEFTTLSAATCLVGMWRWIREGT